MAFEPKTEAGKKMLADGGDIAVVEQMETSGELTDSEPTGKKEEEPEPHVESPKPAEEGGEGEAETPEQKTAREAQEVTDTIAKLKELGIEAKAEDGLEALQEQLTTATQPNRNATSMPVWKHKEEMKKLEERLGEKFKGDLDTALKGAAAQQGGATEADADAIAEEFGLKPEVAGQLLTRMQEALEKKLGLPEIRQTVTQVQEREKAQQEEQGFEKEWGSKETTDALAAIAGDKQITPEVKTKLKELAYTTTYAKYRLPDIIRLEAATLFKEAPKPSRSAEPGRGGAGRGAAQKAITDMSPEELSSMSDEEFMAASDALGKKGSHFTRTTQPKK